MCRRVHYRTTRLGLVAEGPSRTHKTLRRSRKLNDILDVCAGEAAVCNFERQRRDGLGMIMSGRKNSIRLFKVSLCAGMLAAVSQFAFAASQDEIRERCKQALMPQLRVCVMGKMRAGTGDLERAKQECGMAIVRPCVMREDQKQAAKTPPPAAPKDDTVVAPQGALSVQPSFVAPPRTIADITAILDSEKPDEVKIAERKANADAAPPTDTTPAKLAQFYYDRGNARALLARSKDALADGLQALALGKGTIEFRQTVRIRQFVALQYKALGDFKQAIAVSDSIVREAEAAGARAAMINAQGRIARMLVSMGDPSQAAIYAGRVEALVQEARGSPSPKWRQSYSIYGHIWEADAEFSAWSGVGGARPLRRGRGSVSAHGSVRPSRAAGPSEIRVSTASGTDD